MVGCSCCRCAQAINSLIMEPPIISFIKITALCLALVIKWAKVLFWRWSETTCSSICIEDHHLFLYNSMTIQNAQLQAKLYKFCISKSVRSSKRNDEYTDYVRVRQLLLNLFFFWVSFKQMCTHARKNKIFLVCDSDVVVHLIHCISCFALKTDMRGFVFCILL